MAVMSKTKKVSTEKKPSSHPPYAEMIKEAIAALKERTGSSTIAIAKFISDKHKSQNLPENFKKLLLSQLKRMVASGSLVKVKHSFKLLAPVSKPKAQKMTPEKAKSKSKAKAKAKKVKVATPVKKVKKAPLKKAKKETPKKAKKGTPAVMKAKKVVMKAKAKPKSIKSPVKKAKK